jgi:hypothetical protein
MRRCPSQQAISHSSFISHRGPLTPLRRGFGASSTPTETRRPAGESETAWAAITPCWRFRMDAMRPSKQKRQFPRVALFIRGPDGGFQRPRDERCAPAGAQVPTPGRPPRTGSQQLDSTLRSRCDAAMKIATWGSTVVCRLADPNDRRSRVQDPSARVDRPPDVGDGGS